MSTLDEDRLQQVLFAYGQRAVAPLPDGLEPPAPGYEAVQELIDVAARRVAGAWMSGNGAEMYGVVGWVHGRANGVLNSVLGELAALGDADAREELALAAGVSLGIRAALDAIGQREFERRASGLKG